MSGSSSQSEEKPGTTNSPPNINFAIIQQAEDIKIIFGGSNPSTGITMSLLRLITHA